MLHLDCLIWTIQSGLKHKKAVDSQRVRVFKLGKAISLLALASHLAYRYESGIYLSLKVYFPKISK